MKESTIWLEVNVNIGSRSLRINIRKGQSIELVVKEFIREHSLSEQYMPIIISMIKQQVQLKVSQENQAGMHAYTEGNVAQTAEDRLVYHDRSPQDHGNRNSNRTPQHKSTRQLNDRHSPAIASSKVVHNDTTIQKTGTHSKSQLMMEMLKIKEDIERKKEEELSRVKNRKVEHPRKGNSQHPSGNFTEREQTAEIQEELFPGGEHYSRFHESNKSKVFKKIEQQRDKLSSPFSMLKTKTESSLQSHLKEDIVELKGLLGHTNSNHRSDEDPNAHFQKENSYTRQHLASKVEPLSKPSGKSTQREQSKELQQVYNKWKKMEEQRKTQQSDKSKPRSKSKTPQPKKPEKHQASFFYEKGTSFLKEKTKRNEQSFKKLYPFRRVNGSVTPDKKVDPKMVSERLYQQARNKSIRKLEIQAKRVIEQERRDHSPQLPLDPIREQVRRRDKQYDSAMAQLITEGRIHNPNRINVKPTTTFRKTRVF